MKHGEMLAVVTGNEKGNILGNHKQETDWATCSPISGNTGQIKRNREDKYIL